MGIITKKKRNGGSRSNRMAYLTKRLTASAAQKGFEIAAQETMQVIGYNVVAKDGWVVKIDENGNVIERISEIVVSGKRRKINLD